MSPPNEGTGSGEQPSSKIKVEPEKVQIDPEEKVYPANHGYKKDEVRGLFMKRAHLECPVAVNGENMWGHVEREFMIENYSTLLCPTQRLSGFHTTLDGRQIPNIIPCNARANQFSYFTRASSSTNDKSGDKKTE